jgi:hypothetical protein
MSPSTLSATLHPQKSEILLGEPIYVTYELRNEGDRDLQFREGGNQRNRFGRYDDYKIVVTDQDGATLPVLDSSPNFGGRSWVPTLRAQERFEHPIFLPHWALLESAGTFTIRSERTFTVREAGTDTWYGDKGDEISVRAEAPIKVLPADNAGMGAIIEALGKKFFTKDESEARTQAWQKMSAIDDERVIPWFCKGVDTRQYGFVSSSITALGKFKSDEALACIQRVMGLSGPDLVGEFTRPELATGSADNIRQEVANTLSESPHPDAFALLLTMRTDSYDSVRLTVLHAIARRHPKDARQQITAFTKDASAMVRGEAERYLSEL